MQEKAWGTVRYSFALFMSTQARPQANLFMLATGEPGQWQGLVVVVGLADCFGFSFPFCFFIFLAYFYFLLPVVAV